jgi:hypothetical protein
MSDLAGSIRRSLWAIRDHYDEALDAPRAGGISGVRGSKEPPAPGSLEAMQARRDAHMDLAHYARVVYMACTDINGNEIQTRITKDEQRQPIELAVFLDRWAENLERVDRQEAEGCDRDMARHAEALRAIARPERREWVNVGHCPLTVAQDGVSVECGTRLRAYPGKDFITCRGCGHDDTLDWWRKKILGHRPTLVTAGQLVDILFIDLRIGVEVETVRQWAHRGKVTREYGPRRKGEPPLYDWARVEVELQQRDRRAS